MALRRMHSSLVAPQLTKFALRPPKSVEVEFEDGSAFNLSAEFLRVHSPAADSRIRSFSGEKVELQKVGILQGLSSASLEPGVSSATTSLSFETGVIFGRRHVGIMSAEPIGNYGVRLCFDDLHKTGIYTWDYLYRLGSSKFSLMRNYILTLRKHGLTRDPSMR